MTPIRLHPDNPHYFEFRGKPNVLVTSGEHYGAVINLDFDYIAYLDTLASHGFNLTRLFSGTYREAETTFFGIQNNTLNPAINRYVAPWARSTSPGYSLGGHKFDLNKWDDAYFARLKDFVAKAGERGIVVEVVFFCYLYQDELWTASPLCAMNNVNGIGSCEREEVYTLRRPDVLNVQQQVTVKILQELNGFDNVYYELINEPYSVNDGGAFLDWQCALADVVAEEEKRLPCRHLLAQNFRNGHELLADVHPAVSVINFHYATPLAALANWHLNRPVANDETGFKGQADFPYRREAWRFMLSGGAVHSHLDYSFTVEHPCGDWDMAGSTNPGWGSPSLRRQLAYMKRFLEGFEFIRMAPAPQLQTQAFGSDETVLAEPGRQYAVYISSHPQTWDGRFRLFLPEGKYRFEWHDPVVGELITDGNYRHDRRAFSKNGDWAWAFVLPPFEEDIVLKVMRDE